MVSCNIESNENPEIDSEDIFNGLLKLYNCQNQNFGFALKTLLETIKGTTAQIIVIPVIARLIITVIALEMYLKKFGPQYFDRNYIEEENVKHERKARIMIDENGLSIEYMNKSRETEK